MKAIELYPPNEDGGYALIDDYTPMLECFGTIILRKDEEGYSGDTFALIENAGQFGFLSFQWGSCCVCDALQACSTYEDLDKLLDELRDKIVWKRSVHDMLAFLFFRDWEGQVDFWGEDLLLEFLCDAVPLLKAMAQDR